MTAILRCLLWPASFLYRIIIAIWDIYWQRAKKIKLPGRVISVGNITAGGTGKTPLTIYVANLTAEAGLRTAIVAGGYKRRSRGIIEVAANSRWEDVGDEPLEIKRRTTNIRVYVADSKTEAARRAFEDGAEMIVIDDGFQHRRLQRDLDIVCLDWHSPFGPGGLLPGGRLREPLSALRRADMIIYTSFDQTDKGQLDIDKLPASLKIFYSTNSISTFFNTKSGQETPTSAFHSGTVLAFCGLAAPGKFMKSLRRLDIVPKKFIPFGDHHCYSEKDIRLLKTQAGELGADCLLTTMKDAVKIEHFDFGGLDIYWAQLEVKILDAGGSDCLPEFKKALNL